MEFCSKCKRLLPLKAFNKCKRNKSGLQDHCKECKSKHAKEYYKKTKEKQNLIGKIWRANNKEKVRQKINKWRNNNPERTKEIDKKVKRKRVILGLRAAENAKRRAALLQRILPGTDLEAIKRFYQNCPKGMTVDHIIPLQGKTISGLHKVENLQYLTLSENSSKTNKYCIGVSV